MPLPMVHLLVAESLNNEKVNKTPGYYLGVISPDAVHMRDDYVREHKTTSHFGIKNVGSLENVTELFTIIKNSEESERRDFLIGYAVHLLTDKFWLDTLYKETYLKNYNNDPAPSRDVKIAYYNDTDQLDYMIFEKMPWREKVWEKLNRSKIFGIEGVVRSEDVYKWKIRTLRWFDNECNCEDPIKYIKYEDVINFASLTALKIDEFLLNNL